MCQTCNGKGIVYQTVNSMDMIKPCSACKDVGTLEDQYKRLRGD
ncbi:hypothetical protein [Terrihalobacillus insolitus]|nr:hypothetical protein [Terrihalobacillus insolitus]